MPEWLTGWPAKSMVLDRRGSNPRPVDIFCVFFFLLQESCVFVFFVFVLFALIIFACTIACSFMLCALQILLANTGTGPVWPVKDVLHHIMWFYIHTTHHAPLLVKTKSLETFSWHCVVPERKSSASVCWRNRTAPRDRTDKPHLVTAQTLATYLATATARQPSITMPTFNLRALSLNGVAIDLEGAEAHITIEDSKAQ